MSLTSMEVVLTCDALQLCDAQTPGSLVACHNKVLLGDSCKRTQLAQHCMLRCEV